MTRWALLALVLGGLVLLAPRDAEATIPSGGSVPKGGSELQELRAICAALELGSDWTTFLCAVAHHESRWRPRVALGDAEISEIPPDVHLNTGKVGYYEARAGIKAYERNAKWYGACVWSKQRYAYSGGWFGFLPAIGMYAFRDTQHICEDPWLVFDPDASVVMAVDYAVRSMRNYSGAFKGGGGTWRVLNRAWAAPGWMDNPEKTEAKGTEKRWERALKALGVPVAWGERKVTPIKGWDASSALERLRALREAATA